MRNIIPIWSDLKKVQSLRIVKSTYIWLMIVPIFSKFLSKIGDTLVFNINGIKYTLELSLPFSWQLFYLSAICFVIGNVVYLIIAPKIVKEFIDYGDFKTKGKRARDLDKYRPKEHLKAREAITFAPNFEAQFAPPNDQKNESPNKEYNRTQLEKESFWSIYSRYDSSKNSLRTVCSFVYAIGITLFGIVMVQNICWTICAIVKSW